VKEIPSLVGKNGLPSAKTHDTANIAVRKTFLTNLLTLSIQKPPKIFLFETHFAFFAIFC